MKVLHQVIWLFAVGCLFACTSGKPADKKNLKNSFLTVLSWNIWHAGHSEAYGQKACDGCIGILKQSGADVVLMVETYGASDKVGFYPVTCRFTVVIR